MSDPRKHAPFACIAVCMALAGCPKSKPHIHCDTDAQCTLASRPGVCITNACAVADKTCASGYRFDTTAGESGDCVPVDVHPMMDMAMPPLGDMALGPDLSLPSGTIIDMAGQAPNDLAVHTLTWTTVTLTKAAGQSSNAMWGTGPDNLWVVGDAGLIMHSVDNAASWAQVPGVDTALYFYSIWGTSDRKHVWVGGFGGTLLHSSDGGSTFKPVTKAGIDGTIYGLWGTAANNVFAVGGQKTGLHGLVAYASDGETFDTAYTSTVFPASSLQSIWGSGPNDVWVVGTGHVFRSEDQGKNFAERTPSVASVNKDISSVHGTADYDVWVGGAAGLWHTTDRGLHWTPITIPATAIVDQSRGIFAASSQDVYIVGCHAGQVCSVETRDYGAGWAPPPGPGFPATAPLLASFGLSQVDVYLFNKQAIYHGQ